MEPEEFLSAVLPSSGLYCVCEFTTKNRNHFFSKTTKEMVQNSDNLVQQNIDSYFALASFKSKRRTQEQVVAQKSLFVDLDVDSGKPDKAYATKKEAEKAFKNFMKTTELEKFGQPIIVSSGGGYHIYWPFESEVFDVATRWVAFTENFKRLCKQENLKIDMAVTSDSARILRVPGTNNFKLGVDKPRPVKILKASNDRFNFEELEQWVSSKVVTKWQAPQQKVNGTSSERVKELIETTETVFKTIIDKSMKDNGCGQLRYFIENAHEQNMEPLWRAMLSLAQPCVDADEQTMWLTKLHPYEPERMHEKLAQIKGPYSCVKIDSANPGVCDKCKHVSKITNPLILGRRAKTSTKQIEVVVEKNPNAPVKRPVPPRPFSYGAKGGVYMDKELVDSDGTKTTQQIMILSYDLFVVDILQHESEHIVHMVAARPEGSVAVTLPQRAVVSKDETVKVLAQQNIIASYGQGNDKNLFAYVRACVEEASVQRGAVKVPSSYGWQDNNSFVFNEQIYTASRPDPRHVPMRGLHNLNSACSPAGSLDKWVSIVNMIKAKELYGVLCMSLIGFGSPLMRFTGFDGITWHLGSSASGTGKTLALELASSVWGHPTRYRVGKNTSDVAMQQRLGLLNSLPLISDEITSKNRKDFEWFPAFVFDMAEGQGKQRMEAGANKERENTTFWESMALLSSNTHVTDYLSGARKHSSQGEILRVLEWKPTEKISWAEGETDQISALKSNYGVAGHKFAAWLVNNIDTAKSIVAKVKDKLKVEFEFSDDERYWLAGCSALVAGGILAGSKHAGIIDYPIQGIVEILKSIITESRKAVKDNVRTADDVLNTYIREYYGKFVIVRKSENNLVSSFGSEGVIDQTITRSEIFGRVEHGMSPGYIDFYLEEQLLKKYCSSMSFGYSDFKNQIEKKYRVSYKKKDMLAKTKGPTMRVNAMQISRKEDEDSIPVEET